MIFVEYDTLRVLWAKTWQDSEKDPARRLLKNVQIQGARNPEE